MRGLLRMPEWALSLQGRGRCGVSPRSLAKQGPLPSDRFEKVACLGVNWDSRWILHSKSGMKQLGMGQTLGQVRRHQIHQGLDHRIHPRMAGSRSRTGTCRCGRGCLEDQSGRTGREDEPRKAHPTAHVERRQWHPE